MSEAIPPSPELTIFSVDTLVKYMGNDANAVAVVAKIVRDACAPGMLPFEQASAALREQRLTDAGKIFHSLRGSIGTLGTKRLVAASLKLEQAIAEARLTDIPALFPLLEAEYQLVLQHAASWLANNTPKDGHAAPA